MGERWILAVDLGNGGPKVAVVSLEGEVRRTAMRAVSVHIGLDGTAKWLDVGRHLVLPAVNLRLTQAAVYSRITRASALDVLDSDALPRADDGGP